MPSLGISNVSLESWADIESIDSLVPPNCNIIPADLVSSAVRSVEEMEVGEKVTVIDRPAWRGIDRLASPPSTIVALRLFHSVSVDSHRSLRLSPPSSLVHKTNSDAALIDLL
jgi:hypothetical protein